MTNSEKQFLFHAMKHVPVGAVVVEIGSWIGGSSEQLALGGLKFDKKINLFCVDPWDHFCQELEDIRRGRDVYSEFAVRMQRFQYSAVKDVSENAVLKFEDDSVDFIFIDGDHSYSAVFNDITMWLPKLRAGGIMCGHDYGKPEYGVTEAVKKIFGDKVQLQAKSIWAIKK